MREERLRIGASEKKERKKGRIADCSYLGISVASISGIDDCESKAVGRSQVCEVENVARKKFCVQGSL